MGHGFVYLLALAVLALPAFPTARVCPKGEQ